MSKKETPADIKAIVKAMRRQRIDDTVADIISEMCWRRQTKGWSIRKLAKLSGVAASTVSKIESFETDPKFSTVVEIAHALSMELSYKAETMPWTEEATAELYYKIPYNGTFLYIPIEGAQATLSEALLKLGVLEPYEMAEELVKQAEIQREKIEAASEGLIVKAANKGTRALRKARRKRK